MTSRNLRDQMVIATKYTSNYKTGRRGPSDQHSNYSGNSAKSLHLSVESSLAKLQTTYIDILYLHWWSYDTSVEEVMQSLNDLVRAGKVLYLGVSDTPAWIVARANQYARDHGLRQFCVYQGLWSAAERDLEKEILPMCQADGMAIAPWGALGRGHFLSDEARRQKGEDKSGRQMGAASEKDVAVSRVLGEIAERHGTLITSVALAYVMHTSPDVYPIVVRLPRFCISLTRNELSGLANNAQHTQGGRNKKHLQGNIEALSLRLTDAELEQIERATGFAWDFPQGFLFRGQEPVQRNIAPGNIYLTKTAVHLDTPRPRAPVLPEGK